MLQITTPPYRVPGSRAKFCDAVCPVCRKTLQRILYTWASTHKSCGCSKKPKHAMSRSPEYRYWSRHIKTNPSGFPNDWQDFVLFLAAVGEIPKQFSSFHIKNGQWHEKPPRKYTPPTYKEGDRVGAWEIIATQPTPNLYLARCQCGMVQPIKGTVLQQGYRIACGTCGIKNKKHPRTKRRLKRGRNLPALEAVG